MVSQVWENIQILQMYSYQQQNPKRHFQTKMKNMEQKCFLKHIIKLKVY